MKTAHYFFTAMLVLFVALLSNNSPAADPRLTVNFDSNWAFQQGDAPGAEQPDFNDATWRRVNLPFDWSIEGPFSATNKTGGAGGFLPSGVAWYRLAFSLPKEFAGRRVFIEFDGVMANSDVWINGVHLGHRPYGYVSFGYELPGTALHFGADAVNVLAVRADTSQQPASRWYAGAGIYRHVHLIVTEPVHFEQWGVFVTTPQVDAAQATVRVQAAVTNQSELPRVATLLITLLDPAGRKVASSETGPMTISPGDSIEFAGNVTVKKPKHWDLSTPALYHALVRIRSGNTVLDDDEVPFGIREFHFDADTGFWLNGQNFKIKGVCLHADGGAFGMAVPLGVWEERLKNLKALGVNAIRTAHNPPAPEFLDLCDRMGFLVMDEFFDCWTVAKNPHDYHLYFNDWSRTDERDTILRDRNHPSIILYSVGNEIHDTPQAEKAKKILAGLVAVAHEADPTRPVTQALFRPNVSHDYDDGLADMLDVVGTNYRDNELLAAQRAHPTWKIIGTEQRHDRQTWLWLRDNPSHSGQFLWSGVDYLGESLRWPMVVAGSGLLDHTAAPKPMAFERQSWWSDQPMVFMVRRTGATTNAPADPGFVPLNRRQVLFADWTPANLQAHAENVEVYSNCKEVELFLNGKSLGIKTINADASPRNWQVPFAPGELKAVARNNGKTVATDMLRTAGSPKTIVLSTGTKTLSPGWDNVAFVRAKVVDSNGVVIPRADDLISFKISGPGVVAAVDNANNSSHESFQATERHAFAGECIAFVKATGVSGKIVLTATAPGLAAGSISIKAARPSH